jgi:hypothetical protein
MPIRAGLKEELEGLDRHAHGEEAYHDATAIGTLGGAVVFKLESLKAALQKHELARPDELERKASGQ